ncbi:MAG: YncE family protein [Acidimicrobiales bacterium]
MRRTLWLLSGCLSVFLLGPLSPALPAANAGPSVQPSRPIVWVSGQDAGRVFVTQGTTILKTFDFVNGTPAGTPVIPGVGAATPGLTVPSPKPHLIEFSPDGRFAYVSFQNTSPGQVAVIDTTTRKVQKLITIPNSVGLPAGASPRVTQAKSSPDGTFLLVTEIGPPGTLTRVAVDEVARTWNVVAGPVVQTGGFGPACTSFKPDGTIAYVDSSLSPFLGVAVVDPNTLLPSTLFPTAGDPQCGIHNPIILGGVRQIVVTDNGGTATPGAGHIHLIDTTTNSFTEVSPSPIPGANLHDNWPVGLQPVGAPTSDTPNTSYESDRDLSKLHQSLLGTSNDSTLNIVDSNVLAPDSSGCVDPQPNPTCTNPRGAPDTLDGSGNTVFVAMKEAGDLGIIDNFNTQTYLHLVTPDPSCGQVGNTNFHKCFAVHAVTVQPSFAASTSLSCATGTTGGGQPTLSCTAASTTLGVPLHFIRVTDLTIGSSFVVGDQTPCSQGGIVNPNTLTFSAVPAHQYKVVVSTCQKPEHKDTYKVAPNGTVRLVNSA